MSSFHPLSILLIILVLGIDLVLSAAYTAARMAYRSRPTAQRENDQPKHRLFLPWLDLSTNWETNLRLAQTLAHFLLVGLALVWFVPWQKTTSAWLYALGIILLGSWVTILLEGLAERLVWRDAESWANRLSLTARVALLLFSPLLLPLFFVRSARVEESMTEADLMNLVEAGQEDGVIEQEERRMIFSIFRLGDTLAREIMVPRIDIVALDVNTPLKQAVDTLIRFGHSRIPVFHETIDNILGLLYAKDLLRVWQEGNQVTSLQELLRPA